MDTDSLLLNKSLNLGQVLWLQANGAPLSMTVPRPQCDRDSRILLSHDKVVLLTLSHSQSTFPMRKETFYC